MMGGVVLVPGSARELDAVMAVMEASFDPAYGEAWTAPQCAGLLPMPGVWLTLAHDGGEVVGFALSRLVVREAELLLLAVSRQAQGRGVGRKLLESFVADSAARGAERLHLEVRDGNPAVSLYRRMDFREVGRRRNYYRGPAGNLHDALTLARSART